MTSHTESLFVVMERFIKKASHIQLCESAWDYIFTAAFDERVSIETRIARLALLEKQILTLIVELERRLENEKAAKA
jgi:hypothetical protein